MSAIESEGVDLGVGDFCLLNEITMENFVENLKKRFEKGRIYTYIGNVLVSVNPYRDLPLYRPEYIKSYKDCQIFQRPAHIFSLIENAYEYLRKEQQRCCSIVLTGESGSGKSEALKISLRYLLARTNYQCSDLFIQTNAILELFGNCRTNHNSNSSRFGKYFQLKFNTQGELIEGEIQSYFIEKSRVVKQHIGERNFHCFDVLLSKKDYGLNLDIKDYYYLNQGNCSPTNEYNFEQIVQNFQTILFKDSEIALIWKVLASIVHLGNLVFVNIDDQHCSINQPNNELDWIAKLLECNQNDLSSALTSFELTIRDEILQTKSSITKANYVRDLLSRTLYERLFDWLIKSLNRILSKENKRNLLSLGLVDFFGFESIENNNFEQLCMNYADEKLQQLFIDLTLRQEQDEYVKENLSWEQIEYLDNKNICEIFDKVRTNLFTIIDENCQLSNSKVSESLLNSLNKSFQTNRSYSSWTLSPKDKIWKNFNNNKQIFLVRHYAGDIVYSCVDFVEKNRDLFPEQFKRLLSQSTNLLFASMWLENEKKPARKMSTTSSLFRMSLTNLFNHLSTQKTFFIRCIKPNHEKAQNIFDQGFIEHQITSFNLLPLTAVREAGFASRVTYEQFVRRYKILDEVRSKLHPNGPFDKESAVFICLKLQIENEIAYGKTKIFFKRLNSVFQLENKRNEGLQEIVTLLQKYVRSWRQIRLYRQELSARKIQKFYRQYRGREYVTNLSKTFSKNMIWPETRSSLHSIDQIFNKIYRQWRLNKIQSNLPACYSSVFESKLLASKYLQQRSSFLSTSVYQQWMGDYLSLPEENARAVEYERSMNELRKKDNFNQILFSTFAIKLNSRIKIDERAIILTDKYVYKCDMRKNFQIKKNDISIDDILGLSTTPSNEQLIVLHLISEHDLIFYMNTKVDYVGEFIGYLARLKRNSENFFVHVQSQISINVGKQKYLLDIVFDQISKAEFRKTSNTNVSLILPNEIDVNSF